MTDIYDQLAQRLGPGGFSRDPEIIAPHLSEWRGRYAGATPFLALPQSTEAVAAIVSLCAQAGVAITPQGGNTGLVGGQIPNGEVLVSLKRMSRIRAVDATDDALIAEAGVTLAHVQAAAAAAGRRFPLSLASEGQATIGGLISTNAGGVHVVRYGMMRDLVLGLEAVLPDGSIFRGLKSLRKDNTGYDLKQLLIGGEGTLGIVTAASLKLFPARVEHLVAMARVETPELALKLLARAKASGALAAFEFVNRLAADVTVKNVPGMRNPFPGAPYLVLIEWEAATRTDLHALAEQILAAALDAGEIGDAAIAASQTQARAFWALRENVSAGHRPEGAQVNHDIATPVSQTPQFLAAAESALGAASPGARIIAFGHMGDGNIHYTVMQPLGAAPDSFDGARVSAIVNELATKLGGSISAEHGIGVARRHELPLYKDNQQIVLMRAIKSALDPKRIMNPRALI